MFAASSPSEGSWKKIYIATTLPDFGETGVHTHFRAVKEHLERTGEDVEILTPYESWKTLRRLVGVVMRILLPFNKEIAWRFRDFWYGQLLWLRLRAVVHKERSWIVYAQCPVSALAAMRVKYRASQEVVLVAHFNRSHADEMVESGLIREGGSFYRQIQLEERKALLDSDRLVFVSKFLRDHLNSTIPELPQRQSMVIPNFVVEPVRPPDKVFQGDLVSIGTLEARKNQVFLLHVVAAAKRKGHRYKLTLFGTGKPEAIWRQVAIDLGIYDQIRFAGFVSKASRYLHNFRVYTHAATMENLPVSLIEALACGLPILAAPVGGIPEIVDECVTGFFWDLKDPERSADLLIRLLEDQSVLRSMGAAAKLAYRECFDASHVANRLAAWIVSGQRV